MSNCEAIRVNDEMQCCSCGLSWDIKDQDVPACKPQKLHKFICSGCCVLFYTNKGRKIHKCDLCVKKARVK